MSKDEQNMSAITRINNPLALSEQDIIEYLQLEAAAAKAGYEYELRQDARGALDDFVDARVKLKLHKRRLEQSTENFTFDEIMPMSLIEETGYALWKGRVEQSKEGCPDVLVGKIVEHLELKKTEESGLVVATQTADFEGVDVFGNYSGLSPTAKVHNDATGKFYLIRDAAIQIILKQDPSKDIKFQQFYD
jgi:hypothetical protein